MGNRAIDEYFAITDEQIEAAKNRKINLTHENYFSPEMMMAYMSTSQFKGFDDCECNALDELKNSQKNRDCFKEGHYFEACLNGDQAEELFLMQNPDMVSSRGATKGDLKSNFKKVQGAVEAFKRQPMFMEKINQCEKQVIVTGVIAGLKFKGCVDFLNMTTFDGYDTKAMANFKRVWSDTDSAYVNWYYAYGYHYQAAIYRELIRQTFGKVGTQHILAVTKEEYPDVAAFSFTEERLDKALDIICEFAPSYDLIKRGKIEPKPCGHCDYCKSHKIVTEFDIVGDYE